MRSSAGVDAGGFKVDHGQGHSRIRWRNVRSWFRSPGMVRDRPLGRDGHAPGLRPAPRVRFRMRHQVGRADDGEAGRHG